MEKIIKVGGMTCGHCTSSVEGRLGELAGVESVKADLDTGKVTIKADIIDLDQVEEAIEEIGFDYLGE